MKQRWIPAAVRSGPGWVSTGGGTLVVTLEPDDWARMFQQEGQRCETCRFYESNYTGVGECQRFPPQALGDRWAFPALTPGRWCGEWVKTEASSEQRL